MRRSIILMIACTIVTRSMADGAMPLIPLADHHNDNAITMIYDPETGNLGIETNGSLVSTLELDSASGVLTGQRPRDFCLAPLEFICTSPHTAFILKTDGFGETDFGPMVTPDLGLELANDLTVRGSLLPVSDLTNFGQFTAPNLTIVPEPTNLGLTLFSRFVLTWARRRLKS